MVRVEVVEVEEVAEEGACRKPKPTLEVREEYHVFPGLGFRCNLPLRETALDFRRNPVSPIQPVQVGLLGLGPIPAPPGTFFAHVEEVCERIRATLQMQRRLVGVSLPETRMPEHKLLNTTELMGNKIYRGPDNHNKREEKRGRLKLLRSSASE